MAPVNLRAFSIAIFAFFTVVLGLGAGPTFTGLLSDHLSQSMGEADGLRLTITALAPLWAIAGIMTLLGRQSLIRDLKKAAESVTGAR